MKKKVLLMVMLLTIMLSTGCFNSNSGNKENKERVKKQEVVEDTSKNEVKTLEFLCDNEKIQITTPTTWKKYEEGTLNKDSSLELVGKSTNKYLLVISEKREDFASFNAWFDIVFNHSKESYNLDENNLQRMDENGLNIRYIESNVESEGLNIYLQLYYIETDNYYNQILIWTTNSNKGNLSTEFRDIALSLKELK